MNGILLHFVWHTLNAPISSGGEIAKGSLGNYLGQLRMCAALSVANTAMAGEDPLSTAYSRRRLCSLDRGRT